MNTRQIEAFLAVVEEGSFSKAAQRLYTSPTALTQQLNSLEREVGAPLLARNHRGASLTEVGAAFLPYAQSMTDLAHRSIEACRSLTASGTVTIANVREWEVAFLRRDLERFGLANPDVTVEFYDVGTQTYFSLLEQRLIDLFIYPWSKQLRLKELEFQQLGTTRIACVCACDHPLASQDAISFEDLCGETVITDTGVHNYAFDAVLAHLRSQKATVRERSIQPNEPFWADVLLHRQLLLTFAYSDIAPKECRLIPLDWPERIPYGFVYRSNASAATKRFLKFFEAGHERMGF